MNHDPYRMLILRRLILWRNRSKVALLATSSLPLAFFYTLFLPFSG
ncbi:MAG: hypothetical protein ANABAC_1562 [Anaerolineae bacterium]|nr:MAG: hypothetical protein ANABAC_1562 [Anaerolineae bacterium]